MTDMSGSARAKVITLAKNCIESGVFYQTLARRVALPTESQNPDAAEQLSVYLTDEIAPLLTEQGFSCEQFANPVSDKPPLMIASRIESEQLPTLLLYGHGDVTDGQEPLWLDGTAPWVLTQIGDKLYGRGTADNKGQHTINLLALETVLKQRQGKLGYNIKILFEMSEEVGSTGLEQFCREHSNELKADLFLASDGPRLNAQTPTIFLGSRGVCQFRLRCYTGNGARHSGNWGGVITNAAVRLNHALASLVSPTGQVLAEKLKAPKPAGLAAEMMQVLPVGGNEGDPSLNAEWGEKHLSNGERLFGCNTLEIIALGAGNITKPVGAIPDSAEAVCHLRFVPGTDWENLVANLQEHFSNLGFTDIEVIYEGGYNATRLDPTHPWVGFVQQSMQQSLQQEVTVLPNLGGTIPNHCFADVLSLPTVWMPHSYPSCNQHAPDEHLLESVAKQGLAAAAGLFWDLGDQWPV
ncbi:M20 family metallopeptidase [Vibrio nitrifigilis]|uniref:M20 family metallopeptidase n=1 Tax=Vibrio nitrifigilis TaxID=2789781 RepID=A0ABS0GLI2_9VIBR|nr:M20 family metallopeptidase [Vibrio nitrifigilis]MBF9003317.1 M20 family metallopeptidase [Vibrio nitrifigilis]